MFFYLLFVCFFFFLIFLALYDRKTPFQTKLLSFSVLLVDCLDGNLFPNHNHPIRNFLSGRSPKGTKLVKCSDICVDYKGSEISGRYFVPRQLSESDNVPIIIYYFGGGWIKGSSKSVENRFFCNNLCVRLRLPIFVCEYPLAPKNPHPAAIKHAILTAQWINNAKDDRLFKGVDQDRIILSGLSSGGNIAAVSWLYAIEKKLDIASKIKAMILIQPAMIVLPIVGSFDSIKPNWSLSKSTYRQMIEKYLGKEQMSEKAKRWDVNPINAKSLRNLSPSIIITSDKDPLIEEHEMLYKKMLKDNAIVHWECYEGEIHGFPVLKWSKYRQIAVDRIINFLELWNLLPSENTQKNK
ncbi:ab hydrolase superfamily protein c4a8.06c [Anaeramoeba flamelloides]|uniref:Ab hydrolase superfamily protein c4a8.06c n=1 Tax=Anaeramoeba flamelloides TaxID=1746091 RepID=A0ABQ8Y6S5_9EUKA|nr:ab hydrolase superfamily protein c4a8.06c [Anaeramoeba flamelloides]